MGHKAYINLSQDTVSLESTTCGKCQFLAIYVCMHVCMYVSTICRHAGTEPFIQ